ncbi:addiction module protein [Limibacterium fermenti]|uniref:addiction module protein n=1 Tax=Limibacterium fermenti TaxID=3229863 RepID=UPI000E889309|nr:hypothetical protein [Porphyromonadaceae bacterium]
MNISVDLRKRVLQYVDSADNHLLRMMEALAVSYHEDESEDELTDAQKGELDKRLQKYNEGKMVFQTWEETQAKLDRI